MKITPYKIIYCAKSIYDFILVFSQSPMSERDQTSSAVNIIVNSPPKSVYSILKPQTSYSNIMPSQECMLIFSCFI